MEIVVAMTILTVGLLGVGGLTIGTIRGNLASKNVTSATVIAQARLEDVQRAGYTNATSANFPAGPVNVSMSGATYSRLTTINNNFAGSTPTANVKTITVTVSWSAGAHSVALNTILAR